MGSIIKRDRKIGSLIGIIIFAAAIYAIFFINWKKTEPQKPQVVRPLKIFRVGALLESPSRQYPGRVQAVQRVDLAFQVQGQLIEFPIIEGEEMEQGALLSKLDPRDYENTLAAKKASQEKARFDFEKIQKLYEKQVAAKDELAEKQALYDIATAQVEIAKKALNDTILRAPFPGRIAKKLVENFENVLAKQPVLSLQDIRSIEIVSNVPEEMDALTRKQSSYYRFVARFDYLPDRDFEVSLKEFSTQADPKTQTYAITFSMPSPKDVNILPGMTATVSIYDDYSPIKADEGLPVPLDMVPVDGQGQYTEWKI